MHNINNASRATRRIDSSVLHGDSWKFRISVADLEDAIYYYKEKLAPHDKNALKAVLSSSSLARMVEEDPATNDSKIILETILEEA